jgi:hypothetical protein
MKYLLFLMLVLFSMLNCKNSRDSEHRKKCNIAIVLTSRTWANELTPSDTALEQDAKLVDLLLFRSLCPVEE